MAGRTAIIYEPCEPCQGTGRRPDGHTGVVMRAEREAAGLTIEQVAEVMGLTAGYVGDLERDNRGWNNAMVDKFRAAIKELAE